MEKCKKKYISRGDDNCPELRKELKDVENKLNSLRKEQNRRISKRKSTSDAVSNSAKETLRQLTRKYMLIGCLDNQEDKGLYFDDHFSSKSPESPDSPTRKRVVSLDELKWKTPDHVEKQQLEILTCRFETEESKDDNITLRELCRILGMHRTSTAITSCVDHLKENGMILVESKSGPFVFSRETIVNVIIPYLSKRRLHLK